MSRWEELTKQPTAKFITVYNQQDDFDKKGKKILVSPRRTPDFDHFVEDVNDRLVPGGPGGGRTLGIPLRKIYTAAGGSEVRSVSALTISKEYTASPKKFNKNKSRDGSKKNSAASSEGYHSDDGRNSKKKKGNGRLTLMERQALYAKPRSQSEPPSPRDASRSPNRNVSPARKPKPKPTPKKRSPVKKTQKKALSFNERGKQRLDKTFKKDDDSDDERARTPTGKRRVAFRGQYIFVTDDEYEESDEGSPESRKTTSRSYGNKSRISKKSSVSNKSSRKSSIYSNSSSREPSIYSRSNKSPTKSRFSTKSRISEEDEDYSDDDYDRKSNYTTNKSTRQPSRLDNSNNHLSPSKGPSRFSTGRSNKSNKSRLSTGRSKKSSRSKTNSSDYGSDKSRQSTADSGRTTRSDSGSGSGGSRSPSVRTRASTRQPSRKSDSGSENSDSQDDSRAASRVSKYSKYSKVTKSRANSDSGSDSDKSSYKDRASTKSKKGASRLNTGRSSGASSVYRAQSGVSNASTVDDNKDTKVNTPVDMRDASEVSSNNSDEYYSESDKGKDSDEYYSGSDDDKKKSARKTDFNGLR